MTCLRCKGTGYAYNEKAHSLTRCMMCEGGGTISSRPTAPLLDRDAKRFIAAAMAMQGLLADPSTTAEPRILAMACVANADALLAELEKEPTE